MTQYDSFCTELRVTYTMIRIIHPIFSRESCDSPFLSDKNPYQSFHITDRMPVCIMDVDRKLYPFGGMEVRPNNFYVSPC